MKAVILGVLLTAGFTVVIAMLRSKRFFSALILSALQGITALFAADIIGGFAGINLSVNFFTAALCMIGGIPAVIFLLISGVFFR